MKTIREAATKLCDRWDTPLWKDVEHTSVFVHELRMALALTSTACEVQPEERNFCPRCGKRLMGALGPVSLHTCCPPHGRTFDDYGNKIV